MTDQLPPWIVSAPEAGRPPGRESGRRSGALLVIVAILFAIAGGAGYWTLRHRETAPDTRTEPYSQQTANETNRPAPRTESTFAEPPPEPESEPEPSANPDVEALARLEELSRLGLAKVSLDGQYAAQLASKTPGIVDPLQTAADGTHVFRAGDILGEHQRLRDDPANGDATVVLLRSTDYGTRQLYRGEPLYVTFALFDFGSAQEVRAWCADRFADLSGDDLANQCAVRRLRRAT